jgi:hypothetical protein
VATRTRASTQQLEIVVQSITPSGVLSLSTVSEVLRAWSDAIEAVVAEGRPPQPQLHKIELQKIEQGCAHAFLLAPRTHLRAVDRIGQAAEERSMDSLPREARPAVKQCLSLLQRFHQEIEIVGNERTKVRSATLRTTLPESEPAIVESQTMLLGRIRQVGGKDPNFHLELPGGGEVVVEVEQSMAQAIARQLYSMVMVEIDAKWNIDSGEMFDCRLRSWEAAPNTGFADGARAYADQFGSDWNGVDAQAWLRKLRGGRR